MDHLKNIITKHENKRKKCINLLPSENVISPAAKDCLSSDMGSRYFFESPYNANSSISYAYRGTEYIEEILNIGRKVACNLFHAEYASLYPISGHMATIALLFAYCKAGDRILTYSPQYGGYPGLDRNKLPKYLGMNVDYIPTIREIPEMVDIDATIELIKIKKPKLIFYSLAHNIFPFDFQEILKVAKEVGAKFIYDGSHPLGLIAGGEFQSPLLEGADFLIGGTQKSFPGPQGGIILTNKFKNEIIPVEHFVIVDNPHFHRIASLVVTLKEMELFGTDYAKQIISNTQTLAKCLFDGGIPVKYHDKGFTESHMFKIDVDDNYGQFTKKLENINIVVDTSGRIGTAEMTRYGLKETEMNDIADWIIQVYKGKPVNKIKDEVKNMREKFSIVQYTF